jgi:hypothetical protein
MEAEHTRIIIRTSRCSDNGSNNGVVCELKKFGRV